MTNERRRGPVAAAIIALALALPLGLATLSEVYGTGEAGGNDAGEAREDREDDEHHQENDDHEEDDG
jgi:hypothetical protein